MAKAMNFDHDTLSSAWALIQAHGGDNASVQAAAKAEDCLAKRDWGGAHTWMLVGEAILVLLAEKPDRGEFIH
jgi:hypothetical protein